MLERTEMQKGLSRAYAGRLGLFWWVVMLSRNGGSPHPLGFCSVASSGISDSKVNCGVLSLPSSNKQHLECLMFPSH